MDRICVYANDSKKAAMELAKAAIEQLDGLGIKSDFIDLYSFGHVTDASEHCGRLKGYSAILCIGGDGSMLRAAVLGAKSGVSVLGINAGRMGFLAETQPDEMERTLREVAAGNYMTERRMMLTARCGESACLALNEVMLYKADYSKTVNVSIEIDGVNAGEFSCDGVIVCTGSGSTAYSLSAGGPVVHPAAKCMTITPVCPHSLTARPFVINSGSTVRLSVTGRVKANVIADGETVESGVPRGGFISVTTAPLTADFIHLRDYDYFKLVKEKLY